MVTKSKKETSTNTKAGSNASRKAKAKNYSSERQVELISTAAYFIAEKRGFKNGDPKDDWLMAESQLEELFELEKSA